VPIVTSLADKTVERRPVIPAKLGQHKLRPLGRELTARPRQLMDDAPVSGRKSSPTSRKWIGQRFHAAPRVTPPLRGRQAFA
jgi:hypothetical protein